MDNGFIGTMHHRLLVLEYVGLQNKQSIYKCLCDCGNITYGSRSKIIAGRKKSCGCISTQKNIIPDPLKKSLLRIFHALSKKKIRTDITLDYLWELYIQQGGRCYYTGLNMSFENNEYCISVDRLDSSKSYMKDNVVLTCRNVNLFKNDLSVESFIQFLSIMHNVDKNKIPYYNNLSVRNETKFDVENLDCFIVDSYS